MKEYYEYLHGEKDIWGRKIGDEIEFLGIIRSTDITPVSLFKYITIGSYYKISGIGIFQGDIYYKILTDDGIYYPIENFRYTRESMINKYNLK